MLKIGLERGRVQHRGSLVSGGRGGARGVFRYVYISGVGKGGPGAIPHQ